MTEKMKPSGMAWIGDIPSGWEAKRIKYVISDIKDGTHGTFDRVESGELLLSAKNVFDDGIHIGSNESEISYSDYTSIVANGFPQRNDVLLCCVGTIGRCCVYNFEKPLAFQRSVSFLRPLADTIPSFLKYALQSDSTTVQEQLLLNKSAQEGLYMGSVREMVVAMPDTVSEQRAIADFLDTQCAKIDSVIADIEKQIETVQKYKRSLITEAVTKGLDRSAPIQHSGIDWIGTIPAHWNIKKIKYVASKIGSGKTPKGGAEVYEDEGITFIRSQNVYDDGLHLEDVKYISESIDAEMHTTRLLFGDVLFNITGASIGRCCIYSLQDKGNVNQHVCIIRTNEKCYNEYLRYVLNSDIGKVQTAINQMGGNRDSLTFEQIGLFVFPLPPRHEQVEIANVLRDKCKHVEAVINEKKKQLATIHQYKQSLIYEYVTGKKRVTEVN